MDRTDGERNHRRKYAVYLMFEQGLETLRRTGSIDLGGGAKIIETSQVKGKWQSCLDDYRLIGLPQGPIDLPGHGGYRTVMAALKILRDCTDHTCEPVEEQNPSPK